MRRISIRRADLDDVAAFHDGDPVADPHGLVEVVGDEDDGALVLALEPQQLVLHLGADQRVEGGERLVHQHDRRVVGQGAGQADALLHAAGHLARVAGVILVQSDLLQGLHRRFMALGLGHAGDFQAEGGVVERRQVRHQREGLEHHAHVLAADARSAPSGTW